MSYDVRPLGRICLCDIDSGTIEDHRVDRWRDTEAFGPGDLFSFAPPDQAYAGRICRARYSITMFDPVLLGQVAGTGRPVRLLHHRPVDADAARQVRAAIAHLRDDVLAVPAVSGNPLGVSTASRHLAASVLNAFPTPRSPADPTPIGATPTRVRCAGRSRSSRPTPGGTSPPRTSPRPPTCPRGGCSRPSAVTWTRRRWPTCGWSVLTAHAPNCGPPYGETTVTRVPARWGFARPSAFAARHRAVYGKVFADLSVPVFLLDTDGSVRRCNEAAAELTGLSPRDPALRPLAGLIDPAGRAAYSAALSPVVRDGGTQSVPVRFAAPSGDRAVLLVLRRSTMRDESGTCVIAVARDGGRHPIRAGERAAPNAYGSLVRAAIESAVRMSHALTEANRTIVNLRKALRARTVIGQATGIIMAQRGLTADEASEAPARASQHRNVKLADLARTLVENPHSDRVL